MKLRDYQSTLVDDLRGSFRRGNRRPIAVSPTGSGKSVVIAHIAEAASKGTPVLILVHRKELLLQLGETLRNFNLPFGYAAAGIKPDYSQPLQIGMVASMKSRIECLPKFGVIIIDECHHSVSDSYKNVFEAYPDAKMVGFTATPQRLDGKGLGEIFDDIILGPSVFWLMGGGFLSQVKAYSIPNDIDTKRFKKTAGDYNLKQVQEAVARSAIVGDAVGHYKKLGRGYPAIAFCAGVAAAEATRDSFNAAGIPAATIEGRMTPEERRQVISDLTDGTIKVLTSVDVISEGVDIPKVGVAILLRPTQSLGLHLQQVGRILRPFDGKDHSIILDHAGNIPSLGLPQDVREWSLEGSKKKSAEGDPYKTCPACYAVIPQVDYTCPECGHDLTPDESDAQQGPDYVEGELVEFPIKSRFDYSEFEDLKRRMIARGKGWPSYYIEAERLGISFPQSDTWNFEKLARSTSAAFGTYDEKLKALQELGKQNGKAPGWAYHRLKKFKHSMRR